jgi:hypothetical protein
MSYAIEPLIYDQFKGIREYNGVNAGGQISAIQCQNVELTQTEIGNNTGIKSMNGNAVAYALPLGYKTLGVFKSNQDGVNYTLIYGETDAKGTLFYVNLAEKVEVVIDDLTKTGECNGITMASTAFDVFIFTNGKEVRTVAFTSDDAYQEAIKDHNPVKFSQGYVTTINAIDYEGNELHWLSMDVFKGHLVVASEFGVRGSKKLDIYTWNNDPKTSADSWKVDEVQKVTAVKTFIGGLYIFNDNSCARLTGNPNDSTSTLTISAGIGCFSYTSLVKHDAYLFFYDDRQKNVYYLQATDTTGQIRPTGPVAKEIQSFFKNIYRFKMYSCVYNNRNEVWCIINDKILIFDYVNQEWVERKQQNNLYEINDIEVINNSVYSAGVYYEIIKNEDGEIINKIIHGNIYIENVNNDFNGTYFPSVYQTTFINVASNTNLKKQKTPLLITLNSNFVNKFYVQLTINNKPKSPKKVFLERVSTGIYANEDGTSTDPRTKFGTAKYSPENTYKKTVVEISTPQTWYTMGIKIFTEELGQGFFITSMELKNMKVKTKTRGR